MTFYPNIIFFKKIFVSKVGFDDWKIFRVLWWKVGKSQNPREEIYFRKKKAIWLSLGTSPWLIIILFYIFPKLKNDHIFYPFLTVLPLDVTMRLITSLIGSAFAGLITTKFWSLVCPFHSRLSGDFGPNLTSISSVSTLKSFISNWLKFWKG